MIDMTIVVIYLIVLLFIGWNARQHTAESYWVAGRQYGTLRITLSLVATIFGATSTIGIIGLAYVQGLTGAWWLLIGALALLPFGLFLAKKVRVLSVYTLPDILERAYGRKVSAVASLLIVIAWCGVIAAQIIAAGKLVSVIFEFDFIVSALAISTIFILYTFFGGQLSVIKTDVGQLIIFVGSLLLIIGFVLYSEDCMGTILNGIPNSHKSFPVSDGFSWYDLLIFYPLIIGLPYLAGPDIYSRVFCAKDGNSARKATLFAAAIIIPLAFLLAFTGMIIFAKYPNLAKDEALFSAIGALIPAGLKGLIVVGFLGAIMSSADTTLVSAGTILSRNLVAPFKKMNETKQLYMTRVAVVVIGIVSTIIAILHQDIIGSLLIGYTIFVGGVVLPTLAAIFKEKIRLSTSGAMTALIVGGLTALLGKINDGIAIDYLFGETGQQFMLTALGPKYHSILPIALSFTLILLFVIINSIRSRNRA